MATIAHEPGTASARTTDRHATPAGASRLLISERPLQVIPSLAVAIGLNEAIVLQQLHWWSLNGSVGREVDGRRWVYNSYEQWQRDNFPFWSISTINRVIGSLEGQGLIDARDDLNHHSFDRTKWYAVSYGRLAEISGPLDEVKMVHSSGQDAPIDAANLVRSSIDRDHTRDHTEGERAAAPPSPADHHRTTDATRPTRASTLPDDWSLTEPLRQFAREQGLTDREIVHEAKAFAAHWRATGGRKADWHAAWQKWTLDTAKRLPSFSRIEHSRDETVDYAAGWKNAKVYDDEDEDDMKDGDAVPAAQGAAS